MREGPSTAREPPVDGPVGTPAAPGWLLQATVVFLLVFLLGLVVPIACSGVFPSLSPGANSQTPTTVAPSFEDVPPPPLDPFDGTGGRPFIARAAPVAADAPI